MHTNTFWLKFGNLSPPQTLKNMSRSSKSNKLFIMSQCYIHANLVAIRQPVHNIRCTQALLGLNLAVLSPAVTLKIRSRSPKPNQLIIMSQCYIHANLVKIHPSVHQISPKQESVKLTLTPTGSAPKTICPLPFGGGHNKGMNKQQQPDSGIHHTSAHCPRVYQVSIF